MHPSFQCALHLDSLTAQLPATKHLYPPHKITKSESLSMRVGTCAPSKSMANTIPTLCLVSYASYRHIPQLKGKQGWNTRAYPVE